MVAGATLNVTVFTSRSLHQAEMTATMVLGLTIVLNFIGLWMRVGAIRRQTQA